MDNQKTKIEIKPIKSMNKTIQIPGDKSISHRAVMFNSIAKGTAKITGFLMGEDCLSTISCFKELGVDIKVDGDSVTVYGNGLHGLREPQNILDVGNSGTTMRLMTGILSGQEFSSKVTGDSSIQKRPMNRVFDPLRLMNGKYSAIVDKEKKVELAPFEISSSNLIGTEYTLPVASAQVKSAIILASLYADGETIINEPMATRDHTEIMLSKLGGKIDVVKNGDGNIITCKPIKELYAEDIHVPGDISSAAFWLVVGLILENSRIVVENVGINPTRTGIIDALIQMGGKLELVNKRNVGGEEVADIIVFSSKLKGIEIGGDIIPRMIDEIPIFAVAGLFAEGETVVKDAEELKVKESNRIKSMTTELRKMGGDVTETEDGMIIKGGNSLSPAYLDTYMDHRVAMSLAVAALKTDGKSYINNPECVAISYPDFFEQLM